VRGTIQQRLALLEQRVLDGLVVAEAALIRLHLQPNRILLPGQTAPLQGRLAIVAREDDTEMQELFSCLSCI
jgi:porphobilinogen deaminase